MNKKNPKYGVFTAAILVGLLALYWNIPNYKPTARRPLVKIRSMSGALMLSLFAGISPSPGALAAARKYKGAKPATCTAPKRLLNRAATVASKAKNLLGLKTQVVHAQSGCVQCYIQIAQRADCPGGIPCNVWHVDVPISGGASYLGAQDTGVEECFDPQLFCPSLHDFAECYNPDCPE